MYRVDIELNGVFDTYEKLDNALKKQYSEDEGFRIPGRHYNTRGI